ncbi:MAG: hypothetical protein LBS60_04320 [Deltaproteobacteria bacterium]|nr:hypothetical protein [Deltaproteobacteria bacterium]
MADSEEGQSVSFKTVGKLLESCGYRLKANKKVKEGDSRTDRNAQFQYINKKAQDFKRLNQSVISIDCEKHELVGNYIYDLAKFIPSQR